jgi:predicted Fe-Mo cluster-binding NifX family protein
MQSNGLSSEIFLHFGKSPNFTLLGVEDNDIKEIKVLESLGKHLGGRMTSAEIVIQSKADILLCANLGSKAIQMLRNKGIKIFVGASGTVENAFEEWRGGNLHIADENSYCMEGN